VETAHKRDFVLGLVACALALLVLFGVLPWAVKTPKVVPNLALSPTFWPRIILVSLAALSALLSARALLDQIKQRGGLSLDEITESPFDLSDFRVMAALALMVGFCLALEPFGVVLPSIALLLALILMHRRAPWPMALVVSIGTVAVLYLFFRHVAKVPVPLGPLNSVF